jgi:hypothetical protein
MRVPYKAKLLAELPLSTLGAGKTRPLCPGEHASAPRLRVAKPCRGAQRDEGDLLGSDSRNRRQSKGATWRVVAAIDRERGAGVTLVFCDSEEDVRKAHQALDAMSPSSEGSGRRASVELYEIVTDEDMA